MIHLHSILWKEVFEHWRSREASNPGWIHCATVTKGWPDWESWRMFTARFFELEKRTWDLYHIEDPIKELPCILLGPYSGWQSRVENKNATSFQQLLSLPTQQAEWEANPTLQSIIQGLPFDTEFIALRREDTQELVLIDGHHRITAITLAIQQKREINFTQSNTTIAIATIPASECHLFDDALKRGSHKTL